MTILFSGTPAAAIWKTALDGQVVEDVSRRPEQVVYSVTPSVGRVSENVKERHGTYGYRTRR